MSQRKFSYVEQAYFQRWYETQPAALQMAVRGLVSSGQLQFLNGGWSMHDEANPTFVDMLDNTAVGHRNIADNFGVEALPRTTWQIGLWGRKVPHPYRQCRHSNASPCQCRPVWPLWLPRSAVLDSRRIQWRNLGPRTCRLYGSEQVRQECCSLSL